MVITDGVQKVRPGQPVSAAPPQSVEPAARVEPATESTGGKSE
jgi:hypothetical protein